MRILVTGAAGFIGSTLSERLLARGDEVLGYDNLNDYYDPALKEERLARLSPHAGFGFAQHAGGRVDADDATCGPDGFYEHGEACARAAANVDDAHAWFGCERGEGLFSVLAVGVVQRSVVEIRERVVPGCGAHGREPAMCEGVCSTRRVQRERGFVAGEHARTQVVPAKRLDRKASAPLAQFT